MKVHQSPIVLKHSWLGIMQPQQAAKQTVIRSSDPPTPTTNLQQCMRPHAKVDASSLAKGDK